MKPDELLVNALNFSEYSKGGEYSASDICGEPLQIKLKKKYPNQDDVKPLDKVASWVGTGAHLQLERFIAAENEFGATNMESEVKLKFKNLSGTADVILDGNIICDLKTSKEATLKTTIKKPEKWIKQLSVYNYLNHKQRGHDMAEFGYIFWIAVDTRKIGTTKIKLMTLKETVAMIKEFMVDMEIPIEDETKCKSCSWLWKWCPVRKKCDFYQEDDMTGIDDWTN